MRIHPSEEVTPLMEQAPTPQAPASAAVGPGTLDSLHFDDSFVHSLPADAALGNSRRQVRNACFSRVLPTQVKDPQLVAFSPEVAELLGLDPARLAADELAHVFAGNRLLPGMDPYAACYGGHQFGNWAGQLGDGRAISLGEVLTSTHQRWELQLKGAGPTPYSRTADGRAVLRSSLREFLCSEAMHHLGVPTTRALTLVTTGEAVVRDILYDGRARPEPGAVVCRVAPSFVRFGNFEILAARNEHENLRKLLDYVLTTHYPELGSGSLESYAQLLAEVCRRTAQMVVHWMRVGFVHGVMNTDNMSILGLTIDYGPYGFLEPYDPNWTPNTTDASGRRYRYENQPAVAQWNLVCLANAMYALFEDAAPLERALSVYRDTLETERNAMHAQKLGLGAFYTEPHACEGREIASDTQLLDRLFTTLQTAEIDTPLFFRGLAHVSAGDTSRTLTDSALLAPVTEAFYAPADVTGQVGTQLAAWIRSYIERVRAEGIADDVRKARMNRVNPKFLLRNYLAQMAIDRAETGDFSLIIELLDTLRHPYDEQSGRDAFAQKRPEWARNRAGCSMLSCSS